MLRRLLASALLSSVVLESAPAMADPSATELSAARELFREAELDEQRGNFEAALQKMQRVGRVRMTPGVRVHIAFAEEKLGRLVAALDDYSAAEREAEDSPADKREEILRTVRGPLQKLRATVPQLRLDMDASRVPSGIRVSLDGNVVDPGLFNVPMRVAIGEHRVSASAPGYAPFENVLSTPEGSSHRVEITLTKAVERPRSLAATPPSPTPNRAPTWLATGGAVILVGGGVASFLVAGDLADNARSRCAGALTCDSDRSTIRVLDSVAVGGFIGGAALATLAVYLWTRPTPSSQAGVLVTPFGAAGSF